MSNKNELMALETWAKENNIEILGDYIIAIMHIAVDDINHHLHKINLVEGADDLQLQLKHDIFKYIKNANPNLDFYKKYE